MIRSMTGYGKSEGTVGESHIHIELKTLNSKGLEMRIRAPEALREKELPIRALLKDHLFRGKIELNISLDYQTSETDRLLNKDLLKKYLVELDALSRELNLSGDVLQAAMRIPSVLTPVEPEIGETDWKEIEQLILQAVDSCAEHRMAEGEAMAKAIKEQAQNIVDRIDKVVESDSGRLESIRTRFQNNFNAIARDLKADPNRMEQEIIFYLEKMDFTEEIVRLRQHCDYLSEVILGEGDSKGKKLNFITQEMGREINTLGAKAYDSTIQRTVVEMKDELEKIKEQTSNIL